MLNKEHTRLQIATFKTAVIPRSSQLGVKKLTVNYSGSGDEGYIDGIDVEPEVIAISGELEDQIQQLADEFLYSELGSGGDADGCTGRIAIDPIEGKMVNRHERYTTDVDYETKEF
jgi:hypothetical protein